ncbi:F420-dependent oxidoreductase [Kribbella antibiotica]|uniref:F420-dependent oxidoreductase n=1 Tax=Kribbella antibiotica TaxID=190195 RepID=A0A4R4YP57_9ACTN|nr:Pr6Pr family membrane protein [Kribbella antibiotica]TDD46064.1 F420-dependent oxidoreductase [Kribbella antibiotica]
MTTGRVVSVITAAVALGGIVLQLVVSPGWNVFVFFTIQSNLLLGVTALLFNRSSTLFKVLRLNGVLCIAVTGIVYHAVLAGLDHLTGGAAVANFLLHTAAPILGVLGWVFFGPRGLTSVRIAAWSIVYPLLWLAFTLIRGAIDGFYPYPFVNVTDLGYGHVLLNCLLVAVLFLALAAGATALDRRLRKTVEG